MVFPKAPKARLSPGFQETHRPDAAAHIGRTDGRMRHPPARQLGGRGVSRGWWDGISMGFLWDFPEVFYGIKPGILEVVYECLG